MRALALILAVLLGIGAQSGLVRAHALEPGYLELKPLSENTWRVFWSRPDVEGRPMGIDAVLPDDCETRRGPDPKFDGRAWTTSWVTTCSQGMSGGALVIEGLERTRTDVMVRYELDAGAVSTKRLVPAETGFAVSVSMGWTEVLWVYLSLGFDHILGGIDHLLFVFALLLLIPDRWRLVGAITAFTVAHSITLAAATVGLVSLPSAPVEAVIALSIMFLATELVKRRAGVPRVSERYPWIVSFSFGLLHGFGFAGALSEIGLPQGDVPLALLAFNLGVEAGQLAFVAVVVVLGEILRRILPALVRNATSPGAPAAIAMAYGIGAVSAFWFLERVSGFV